jgi:FolB domain-containing protein
MRRLSSTDPELTESAILSIEVKMDIIHIRDLKIQTIIGVHRNERLRKKPVTINIQLFCDLRKAGISDDINDTIDYKMIEDKVTTVISNNEYFLIERIAEVTAEICLETAGVEKVRISVEKAGTLSYASAALVEIERPSLL